MKTPPAHDLTDTRPTLDSASFFDPRALMRIKNLELRAKAVVEGFWKGIHRSPYHGFSVEFTEYRQYTRGDDPRYLDWKLYARSDRYYIKKYEEETNLRVHLLVDNSRSMEFGSREYPKAEYARTLAATLAYFLYTQGDAVGALTFAERAGEYIPARHRSGHLRHLMHALERAGGGTATDLHSPLGRIAELLRKRGLIILISDFLAPVDDLQRRLGTLTACGHEVFLFQVLDPAEIEFEFDAPAIFHDIESGRDLFIDPDSVRAEYQRKMEAHTAAVQTACRKLGALYQRFSTDQPLELALFAFLSERMHQTSKTTRRATTA